VFPFVYYMKQSFTFQYLFENRIHLQNIKYIFEYELVCHGCNTACGRLQIACNDVFCFTTLLGELTES
jgi:hypothetical protein